MAAQALANFKIEGIYKLATRFDVAVGGGVAYALIVIAYKLTTEPRSLEESKAKAKSRPAWVRPVSIIHNGILAALSISMAVGMGFEFWSFCGEVGLQNCMDLHRTGKEYRNLWQGASGFWMWLFCASKFYEFVDTFIMMGKYYELIFLHWWHHATVPLLCSIHALEHTASAWTGSWANCVVHSVMYSYYTWVALGGSCPMKSLVTVLQLIQFVVVLTHISVLLAAHGFWYHPYTFAASYSIYFSYLVLFINFFRNEYLEGRAKKNKKQKKSE